jgi:hypothetical protein
MTQFQLPLHVPVHIEQTLARHAGAEVTTHLAPYERGPVRHRKSYTVAEIQASDGSLIQRAVGPSKASALMNLETALSLR